MASKDGTQLPPSERQRLTQQVAIMQKAVKAQNAARDLRAKAKKIADPKERSRILQEAYDKELEAHGNSKLAQRMQSGAWQGFGLGGGIGAGTGLGIGAAVGTLVGGLVSIPTTAVGALVGTGVGIIHGPFIKFGAGEKKRFEDAKPEEVVSAMEQGRVEELPESEKPPSPPAKRKPRKIQVRSHASADVPPTLEEPETVGSVTGEETHQSPSNAEPPLPSPNEAVVRRPRKIQIRSRPKSQDSNEAAKAESTSKDHDSVHSETA